MITSGCQSLSIEGRLRSIGSDHKGVPTCLCKAVAASKVLNRP
jgi:hypothetical protein